MIQDPIALTIDVEGSLSKLPARVDRLLGLFADHNVNATFFVLGEIAEAAPDIIRKISGAGHEIGFHGYRHVPVSELTPPQLASQLTDWRNRLQDITQEPVRGFRAPYFSVYASTAWALDAVARAGFQYDSSIYPGFSDRFGWLKAPKHPVRMNGSGLILFPVPILCGALPVGFSGGGYLRLLPWAVVSWGFRRGARRGVPGMIYAHPWELEPSARNGSSTKSTNTPTHTRRWSRWREATTGRWGRRRMHQRLEWLLARHRDRLAPMGSIVSALRELPAWNPPQ